MTVSESSSLVHADDGTAEKRPRGYDELPKPGLSDLVDLFSRPRRFFGRRLNLQARLPLFLVSLTVGIGAFFDRLDARIMRDEFSLTEASASTAIASVSWGTLWAIAIVFGLVSAGLIYLIGGWWYGVRIQLAGESRSRIAGRARAIYMWACFVQSLPFVVFTIGSTFAYPSYMAAYNSDEVLSAFLPIMIFWSVAVSYVAVRENYNVVPWKAQLWFLYLPAIFYFTVIGGLLAVLAVFA